MVASTWNVDKVKARAAQALMPRLPNDPDSIAWGEIEIAQIDTGCTRHRVFGPWAGDDSPILRPEDGLNLIDKTAGPFDPLDYAGTPGHGTRIQSVLCGRLAGAFFGVAPGVPTIPYRAIDNVVIAGKRPRKRIAAAIRHAVDINACEVISLSLGFPFLNPFGTQHLGAAVDHAYENGVIVVAAGGQVVDRVTYPGKFSRTIGVGGSNEDDEVYFRYEPNMARRSIDVWAPAEPILRANSKLVNGEVQEDEFKTGDGTSYATAHVAAAAAMWLAFHGEKIDQAYPKPWQRSEAFRAVLAATGQPVKGDYWPDPARGILDLEAVLKADLPDAAGLKKQTKAAKQVN